MSIVPARGVQTSDGRVVGAVETGALAGTPVLVFHPTPSCHLFVRQHADAARRTGVRLVGFSRPGAAGSTMAAPGLRVVAEDALRVADAFGLSTFAALGYSGGTPFAAATAALFPDRVTALGLCAAVAPRRALAGGDAAYDEDLAGVLDAADRDPLAAMEALTDRNRRELGPLLALDDDRLAARLVADADAVDREFLTPELAMGQAVTLREALSDDAGRPTYDSPAFDHVAFGRSWDVDVREVRAPTLVWQGDCDPVTPPPHGAWWAGEVSHARLVTREGRGHLGTFEGHRDEMLTALRDLS